METARREEILKSLFHAFNRKPMAEVISEILFSTTWVKDDVFAAIVEDLKKEEALPNNVARAIKAANFRLSARPKEDVATDLYARDSQESSQNMRYYSLVRKTMRRLSSKTNPTYRQFWPSVEAAWNRLSRQESPKPGERMADAPPEQFEKVISEAEALFEKIRSGQA